MHWIADGSGFGLRDNWWMEEILHTRAKQLAIWVYLGLLVMVWWPQGAMRQLTRLQRSEIMTGITLGLITISTLKRFSLLCAQGAEDPRGLSRLLSGGAPSTSGTVLMAGLELLAQLDTRKALQAFRGPQLHLFAGLDGLVPAEAASALLTLLPDVEIGLIEQASHAFLLEDPHGVAGAIQAFLHESGDD